MSPDLSLISVLITCNAYFQSCFFSSNGYSNNIPTSLGENCLHCICILKPLLQYSSVDSMKPQPFSAPPFLSSISHPCQVYKSLPGFIPPLTTWWWQVLLPCVLLYAPTFPLLFLPAPIHSTITHHCMMFKVFQLSCRCRDSSFHPSTTWYWRKCSFLIDGSLMGLICNNPGWPTMFLPMTQRSFQHGWVIQLPILRAGELAFASQLLFEVAQHHKA